MEPHVKQSLIEAGIGPAFHDKKLPEMGDDGEILWHRLSGELGKALRSGAFVTLEGYDRETVMVLAKTLHINGLGVRILSLSRLWTQMQKPTTEAWEAISENPVLMVNPAQTDRACPLDHWQRDVIEDYLLSRLDNRKSVVFTALDEITPEGGWWSRGFLTSARGFLSPVPIAPRGGARR